MGVFALGLALGFVAYGAYQQKLEVLVPVAIVLAVLTWFGSATDILGLLREWYKDKKEEERRQKEEEAKAKERLANVPDLHVTFDKNLPDQFTPFRKDDRIFDFPGVERRHIWVRVKNDGGDAIGCEAILKVTNNIDKYPSAEEKYLQWVKHNITELNIPRDDDAYLNIAYSIDRTIYGNRIAFVGTPDSLNGPNLPSEIDGFKIGDYDLDVKVKLHNGNPVKLKFKLIVKEKWQDLTMDFIGNV